MNSEDLQYCNFGNIEEMNRTCFCLPVERALIDASILRQTTIPEISNILSERRHLFANTSVFISVDNVAQMKQQIDAFEALALLDSYQTEVLDDLDEIHSRKPDSRGLFMGYDFHITPEGPRLIEVNTNAGGGFLVDQLRQALQTIHAVAPDLPSNHADIFIDMFVNEWLASGREGVPNTIAIVDQNPADQYLFPDMLLAQEYLSDRGIETFICDSNELTFKDGQLYLADRIIDMVYNRLTDFSLDHASSRALREAFLQDAIVLSPSPRHHALYANKKNLTGLGEVKLRSLGLSEEHIFALADVPQTFDLTPDNANEFWAQRKQYFFKPTSGFGGKATYRGAKITKRVWEEISKGGYIAQRFIPPTTRAIKVHRRANGTDEESKHLKYDLRVYTYAGEPLLMAARVYQGQTTNFRTAGGGFATVFTIEES